MRETPVNIKYIVWAIGIIIAIILFFAILPFVVIGAGERGVVFNSTTGIENRIMQEGFNFKIPFVESVVKMPVRIQNSSFAEDTATIDQQHLSMNVSVNWKLNPKKVNNIYQNIGDIDMVEKTVLTSNVQEAVKASVSKFNVTEIQGKREVVKMSIEKLLSQKLSKYDIIIYDVNISNFDPSPEYKQAIENKQLAKQDAETAVFLKQKAVAVSEGKIATAQGDAQVVKINAEAQSEAQKLLQQSLTPELIQKMWIEKWNGAVANYQMGGTPLIQIPTK